MKKKKKTKGEKVDQKSTGDEKKNLAEEVETGLQANEADAGDADGGAPAGKETADETAAPKAGEGVEAQTVKKELEAAQKEIAELKDKLLRSYAEMENVRKRAERQVAEAHKFGIEKLVTAMLDVIDNLERALDTEEGNEAALRKGVELTLKSWHDIMKRFEVARIDAKGKPFDPHLHEALSQVPSDEPKGIVVAQHVAGYTLHGRLIRPAKVLVSSGPVEQEKKEDPKEDQEEQKNTQE